MVTDRAPNVKSFPVEQRKPFKVRKPKKWSHQDDLEAAIGKRVRVGSGAGNLAEATLLAADAFTLKLQFEDGLLTVFKHSITAYEVL